MSTVFELFRYQIIPQDRFAQVDLLDGIKTIEELIKEKNNLFRRALISVFSEQADINGISSKILYNDQDFFYIKIAKHKELHRETKDFQGETLDDWPSTDVIIWNHPDKQIIAVKKRNKAFLKCTSAVNLIINQLNKRLTTVNLTAEFEPQFVSDDFWKLIHTHDKKIKQVEFEFITPNMAGMSKNLTSEIKSFAKITNTNRSKLTINSAKDSALNLDQENDMLSGLVDYSSKGGGNISLKVQGITKTIKTSNTIRETSIDSIEIEAPNQSSSDLLELITRFKEQIDDARDL